MALQKISYGMYVVGSVDGDKINGQIANSAIQVTNEPPTIAVSINRNNLTHDFITKNKVFSLSILTVDAEMTLIGHFGFKSGRDINKAEGVKYKKGRTGVPIFLDSACASLEAEVISSVVVGTHEIFIGKVVESEVINANEPMTYAYYHAVKKGKSPKSAPTYIKTEEKKETGNMDKFVCKVCGYVYDPAKGDPESGIKPGTAFDAIPNTWVCPVCGAGKEAFEKVK
jgi:flavin reductase (DIM6/NTAB) family NADH-FMN oxidoreductase RutF/rubredoxin